MLLQHQDRGKQKVKSAHAGAESLPQREENVFEDNDSSGNESDNDPMAKDETEERLEKLLFGDTAGFHSALKGHEKPIMGLASRNSPGAEDGIKDELEAVGEAMDNVDDADLFFLDTGTAVADDAFLPTSQTSPDVKQDEYGYPAAPAAWTDSDDDRIIVSLAGNHRLRKLRVTQAEDLIGGGEYIKRLRRQYERLHPPPAWANLSVAGARNAKRRKGGATQSGEDAASSTDDVDTDGEEMSLQPLTRLLQNAGDLIRRADMTKARTKLTLREQFLDIQRLKDVGGTQPSSVDSLCFHPRYPLLLSSGPASTLFLHHISPTSTSPNALLTSLHVRRTPLHTSAFAPPAGNRIFFSGRRRFFHIWDLDTGRVERINGSADRREEQKSMERFKLSPCGRWMGIVGTTRKGGGIITVLDAVTLQWIAQVRIDSGGGVADFAWWGDGEGMCVVGKNGEVNEWDGRNQRVIARWIDEGAVGTTVVSLGGKSGRAQLGGDRWIAIGSSSGIVNIYDRRPWAAAAAASAGKDSPEQDEIPSGIPRNPPPTRTLDQLTTPTSHLIFSADGQLLVMASRWKKDALRLIHVPSCSIYKNWPTANTPFGRISAVAIAPTSDLLAVANEQGKIRLWQIHG